MTLVIFALGSCTHDYSSYYEEPVNINGLQDKDPSEVTPEDIQANIASYFGTIDPNQDWNMITTGTVSITADADIENIVKVQILTSSPFLNEDVWVLNETEARNGETVTLAYDAPSMITRLVAACVNDKGVYRIQVFSPDESYVSFATSSRARTRSAADDMPDPGAIVLGAPAKSWNALRAEVGVFSNIFDNKTYEYTEWQDGSWIDDRLWAPLNGTSGSWTISNGAVFRPSEPLTDKEAANILAICEDFLNKTVQAGQNQYAVNNKNNNLRLIRQSKYFSLNNNYLDTDGRTPIILTPIQTNTSEYDLNQIYYYYFRSEDVAGMSSQEQANYIKRLPKYKAIHIKDAKNAGYSHNRYETIFRGNDYLLPFYAGTPEQGMTATSAIFPKGYKIGFLNRKSKYNDLTSYINGCTYGDGRLNVEINHLIGHFNTPIDRSLGGKSKEGMQWDDPRIAFFSANGNTYMCFEDGSDNNFCDMIIEVRGGTKAIEETIEIYSLSYTMCFEDSPISDYDLNDVVLQFERVDKTHVKVALTACGAYDELFLCGLNGTYLNGNQEIHAMFGVDSNTFVNTDGAVTKDPIVETFEVAASSRLSDFLENIYLYDKTQDRYVTLAGKNDDPHAIVVPSYFDYPLEKTNINNAYPLFKNWAQDAHCDRYWFKSAIEEYIYKK